MEIRLEAENTFNYAVKKEMQKRTRKLYFPYSSSAKTDTIPLTLFITTNDGTKRYEINAEKSKKNISQDFKERSLHSVSCEENPLSADTLQQSWHRALANKRIPIKTKVALTVAELDGKISKSESSLFSYLSPSHPCTVSYIGNRCEVEVAGIWEITWWSAISYDWLPFCGIIIAIVLAILFISHLHKVHVRSMKGKVREIIKLVKAPQDVKPEIYQLSSGLFFNTYKQCLIYNNNELKLAPQQCIILKLFLDASDYTISDNDLLQQIWRSDKSATINRFRVASQRLCKTLQNIDFHIEIKRVGSDKYRLLLPDIQ